MDQQGLDLAARLGGAVGRGEIAAWYQPQIDLQTSKIIGAEALCRWRHPDLGLVPPDRFIPIAEKFGMISEIGRYMAEAACVAIAEWNLDVSVNVSPTQLEDSTFASWLERTIRRLRIARGRLTLEITEGRALEHFTAAVRRLDRLRAAGAGVSIDDFGAGHASVAQLRRLHGTELKIDRGLVTDGSAATFASLTKVVTGAHEAGVRVVAEGIETAEHLERAIRLGCDRAQGYLLGRPMMKADFSALLATN